MDKEERKFEIQNVDKDIKDNKRDAIIFGSFALLMLGITSMSIFSESREIKEAILVGMFSGGFSVANLFVAKDALIKARNLKVKVKKMDNSN